MNLEGCTWSEVRTVSAKQDSIRACPLIERPLVKELAVKPYEENKWNEECAGLALSLIHLPPDRLSHKWQSDNSRWYKNLAQGLEVLGC